MFDDDDDNDEEEVSGPASGGYGSATDDDDDEDEEEDGTDPETERRADAEVARGKNDRAFYDNLAKEEDARHNAMRVDLQKRSLAVGELRQKLHHKESELRELSMKITIEEDRIDYEKKKAYRRGVGDIADTVGGQTHIESTPILSKDIDPKDIDEEFSVERAEAHIKQMKSEKIELEEVLRDMLEHMHKEERALSQLQHQLIRM
ncbi:MAG: EF hand domain protein [Parcubacteria group bacterium GW2011_GWA2_47_7]|nr:MAG: EF hand domain protein [Parcubacteria group bacterium GW2011_GWA2_47_7]